MVKCENCGEPVPLSGAPVKTICSEECFDAFAKKNGGGTLEWLNAPLSNEEQLIIDEEYPKAAERSKEEFDESNRALLRSSLVQLLEVFPKNDERFERAWRNVVYRFTGFPPNAPTQTFVFIPKEKTDGR